MSELPNRTYTFEQRTIAMQKSKRSKTTVKPIAASDANPENVDLKKVSLHINAFGEIVRDIKTDDINAFLDQNVPDKKFLEE